MKETLLMIGCVVCFFIGAFIGGLIVGYLVLYLSISCITNITDANDWISVLRGISLYLSAKFAVVCGAIVGGILCATPCILGLAKEDEK
jgi:NhaP-type Na+/H+ or K+/H+ antiporter